MKSDLPREVQEAVKNIVWMARRYAEGRHTYAPEMFNQAYDVLKKHIDFKEENDPDNWGDGKGTGFIKNFPYATKGEI